MYKLEGGFQNSICQHCFYVLERTSKNGCHQCLCPQGELQLHPAFPGDSPRSSGRSDPGSHHTLLLPWVPEYVIFYLYSVRMKILFPLALLKLNPTCLQSQKLWSLIFTVQDDPSGEPHVGFKSLTRLGELSNCRYSPISWVALQGDLALDYIMIPPLPSPHCGFSLV